MEGIKAPDSLQFADNLADAWKLWRQQFDNFLVATDKAAKEDSVKVAIFLSLIGVEGLGIYNTFDFDPSTDRLVLARVIDKFDAYCSPRKNLVYEHFKFFSRSQHEDESTDQYLTELKKMAARCDFAEKEVMLRDRIVLGTKHVALQEKMLRESDLKLERAIEYCHAYESSKRQIQDIQRSQGAEVDVIDRQAHKHKIASSEASPRGGPSSRACDMCGYSHPGKRCPARGKKCRNCSILNHFAIMCRSSYSRSVSEEVGQDPDQQQDEVQAIVWGVSYRPSDQDWTETVKVDGRAVRLKVDTGSQVNLLNMDVFQSLYPKPKVYQVDKRLLSYTGHSIPVRGTVMLMCNFQGIRADLEFFLVQKEQSKSILGLRAARLLGLVTFPPTSRVDSVEAEDPGQIVAQYDSVFSGPGVLNKCYRIRLDRNNVPVSLPPRKIPLALQEQVKAELQLMVDQGILAPVVGPTEWANPIVVVRKPDKSIRICMDPRGLNKYVKREKCWIPTPETVFAQLGDARVFTVLDASQAFHQIKLDHNSSRLCTITTPFGRFRYTRLPYGLSSAPEVFQQAIGDILEGIPGTLNYIDDILVYGATRAQHNARLKQVLDRVQQSGLKLSKGKMQLAVDTIKYLGHIVSPKGIQVDPEKTRAIADIPPPATKKDLQRFLGLTTYIAKYIPNMSEITAPLRALLSNKTKWEWESQGPQQIAFDNLKRLVSNTPTLRHYSPTEQVTLSVDASSYGLGVVLFQSGGPVAYASASLTQAQRRYSQIEKELLAVAYACDHFNYYVFGRHITIQTDHKPLLAIVEKPIDELTPRLQRLVVRLLRYTFTLVHVPGKSLFVADALSRDPSKSTVQAKYIEEVCMVCPIHFTTPERAALLAQQTKNDPVLSTVVHYCREGWPPRIKSLKASEKKYWDDRHTLHVEDDLLYKGEALCIPTSLQKEFLHTIHGSHQGAEACKARARQSVYWPGIFQDIRDWVLKCDVCQRYSRSNPRESLTPHEIPKLPWQKVGIDFKTHKDMNFLVLIDYFSKFVMVNKLQDKTGPTIILALKNIFAVHGFPLVIISDNGPPFDSTAYLKFLDMYNIQRCTSSPGFPQSNGMVERAIQEVKAMIHKACTERDNLMLAVLNHNSTPKLNAASPAEMLMGRKVRNTMPTSERTLRPLFDTEQHYMGLVSNAKKMTTRRREFRLQPLIQGQPVYYQKSPRCWEPAQVLDKLGHNSFTIVTASGRTLRRNRIHIKPRHDNKPVLVCAESDTVDIPSPETQRTSQSQGDNPPMIVMTPTPVGESDHRGTEQCVSETQHLGETHPDCNGPTNKQVISTRSGRVITPPVRLDL